MNAAPPSPARRRWRLPAALALASITVCAALAWLLATGSGLRTLAAVAPYLSGGAVRAEGVSGALRGPFAFSRLTLDLPAAKIEMDDIALDWRPSALLSHLAIDRLRVARIAVFLKDTPPSPTPPALPESLRPPFAFALAAEIGALEIHGADADEADGAAPVFVLREGHLTLDGTSARLSLNQL
ncbi:MAG: hypothetical protein LBF91_10655, partial [Azoarcus sp.]|nr:hypothetical protein [Azoarcus sp.]